MTFDFLFVTAQPGLLMIDIPFPSTYINFAVGVWLLFLLINFVLGVLKRLPFL